MHDALVIGLGAMGSAALHHLSSRGIRAIGVDRYAPPHALGSTHGHSRIIREAYYEHPSYVPLVRRAYENWAALERESGDRLFTRTGALMIGAPGSELVRGTTTSAREHDLDVEFLEAGEIRRRFPAFNPDDGMVGVLEKNAGVLAPEACIRVALDRAVRNGAEVRTNTVVTSLSLEGGKSVAQTSAGPIAARRVVVCAGPWTTELLASCDVTLPLAVERQTMHWLGAGDDAAMFSPDRFPVAMIEDGHGVLFYCLPDMGDGVKAAIHHGGAFVTADSVSRIVDGQDRRPVEALAARFLPAAGAIRDSAVCLYTDTPDRDFIIDELATGSGVYVVSACSGHGFKFASAIGEVAACLCTDAPLPADISRFTMSRFGSGKARVASS